MSNKMKVRTESIISLSAEIKSANDEIEQEYNDAIQVLTGMFSYWDGKASDASMETLNNIKTSFKNVRYLVIDNYVRFLRVSVGQGYEAVEKANDDLSKNFI